LKCCVELVVGLSLLLSRGIREPPRQRFRSVAVEHYQLTDSPFLKDLRPGRLTSSGLFCVCADAVGAEQMTDLLPLFVNLTRRRVVVVGGGPVAGAKVTQLLAAGADVHVVAPEIHEDIVKAAVTISRRRFVPADLDGAWLVVAAATPDVNRSVAAAAEGRQLFVNAVDDPANATAFLSGVIRRDGVTLAISTSGDAPGLTALLREALDAVLPSELGAWVREARRQRVAWKEDGVPMSKRRPLLLEALNKLYGFTPEQAESQMDSSAISAGSAVNGRGGGSWQ